MLIKFRDVIISRGDYMAKVVGIGGIFLGFKGNEEDLHKWYESNLGLCIGPYGASFYESRELSLLTFKRAKDATTPYINFRVDDLEALLQTLLDKGIQITSPCKEYPYGKFAQIIDPFGNSIELWEAYEKDYRRMIDEENAKKIKK